MMVFQFGFRSYGVLWPIESVGWEVYAYPRASTSYQNLVSSGLASNTDRLKHLSQGEYPKRQAATL
jgi:hypothetical protein